ncbi:kynurenine formamidase isoform X6 [Pelodiscus sinensis]|uniref:kynurenine formamidase isoform X6 n=1 Tax=Pelodiscus sinensis TaxID=13735 RepID=UPI003F6B84A7
MGPGRAGPTPRAGGRRGLLCAGHAASRAQPVRAGGGSDMGRWQDMTDEELDRQYSPSRWSHRMEKDAVIEAHVRELAEGTRRAQDTLQTRLHVPYGDSDGEKLDMYLPTEPSGAFPLLLYIHGGYWQFLSKEVSGFAAPPLVTRGVAVAAVGYDVAPKGCMDAMVAQVRRSVAFLVQQYPAIRSFSGEWSVRPGAHHAHLREQPAPDEPALRSAGWTVSLLDIADTDHFDVIEKLSQGSYILTQVILNVITRA